MCSEVTLRALTGLFPYFETDGAIPIVAVLQPAFRVPDGHARMVQDNEDVRSRRRHTEVEDRIQAQALVGQPSISPPFVHVAAGLWKRRGGSRKGFLGMAVLV